MGKLLVYQCLKVGKTCRKLPIKRRHKVQKIIHHIMPNKRLLGGGKMIVDPPESNFIMQRLLSCILNFCTLAFAELPNNKRRLPGPFVILGLEV